MSRAIGRRWYEETSAAEETDGTLSTMAVLMLRSIACTVDACDVSVLQIAYSVSIVAHVYYPAQRPYGICSVNHITPHRRILHNTACDHDDILRSIRQLLDNQVHHLPERGIFVLEQLRNAKEEGCRFIRRELLAGEEEQRDLGQEYAAFSW